MATIMPMILKADARVRGYSEKGQENIVDYMNERIDALEQGNSPQPSDGKPSTGLLIWRFNRSNAICTIILVLTQKNHEM